MHLFGCLYYCISDARSHKHQIQRIFIVCLLNNKIMYSFKEYHWACVVPRPAMLADPSHSLSVFRVKCELTEKLLTLLLLLLLFVIRKVQFGMFSSLNVLWITWFEWNRFDYIMMNLSSKREFILMEFILLYCN